MGALVAFTLFGSWVAFLVFLVVLFAVFILSDAYENGFTATIALVIFLIANYYWGNFPILDFITFPNIFLYLISGFIFSLVRTIFKGRELKSKPNEKKNFELKEHVFRWWLLFPFSLVNWVFGRLLRDLYDFVYKKLSKFYEFLFNL